MSGSAWNTFATSALGVAARVNENFDWIEGDIVPINGSGTKTHNTYNFGSSTYRWKSGYFSNGIIINSTQTITSVDASTIEISAGVMRLKAGGIRGATANSGGSGREILPSTTAAGDLRSNCATAMTTSSSGGQVTGTTITAAALTTVGTPVLVCGFAQFVVTSQNTTSSAKADIDLSIHRYNMATGSATSVAGGKLNWSENGLGQAFNAQPNLRIMVIDSPGANNFKYEMRWTQNFAFSASVARYALTFIELKA